MPGARLETRVRNLERALTQLVALLCDRKIISYDQASEQILSWYVYDEDGEDGEDAEDAKD